MSSARSVKKQRPAKAAKATKAPKATKVIKATKNSGAASNATVEMCRELAALVEAHTLSELIVDTKEATLTFRRGLHTMVASGAMSSMPAPAAAPAPAAPAAAASVAMVVVEEDTHHKVTSPFVGTFYRAPNPDSPSYCEVGQRVEKGQVLCIVEAMKLMNEIEADVSGTIEAITADNAEPVEYGQTLFKIKI